MLEKKKKKTSKKAAKVLHKHTLKVMLVSHFSLLSDKNTSPNLPWQGKWETLDNVPVIRSE